MFAKFANIPKPLSNKFNQSISCHVSINFFFNRKLTHQLLQCRGMSISFESGYIQTHCRKSDVGDNGKVRTDNCEAHPVRGRKFLIFFQKPNLPMNNVSFIPR